MTVRYRRRLEIETAEARSLRASGVKADEIAAKLGMKLNKVYRITRDAVPPRAQKVTLPDDPILKRRVIRLIQRGFDVPPSKLDDWEGLGRLNFTIAERKEMLKLE